eukprot:CAMPEP_0180650310 /NCGR_PEP_ID=MMETSP1037_2-20121125/52148_1 /TAXON_ID=632150 /ORGANISM="Azadinium spinosum, Strain 3D9" /LENGTH=223 /DNA_ID=CAMNT_0022675613 /DNA_START=13 /DNA_END=681 /DNA_ORIENTATION=+
MGFHHLIGAFASKKAADRHFSARKFKVDVEGHVASLAKLFRRAGAACMEEHIAMAAHLAEILEHVAGENGLFNRNQMPQDQGPTIKPEERHGIDEFLIWMPFPFYKRSPILKVSLESCTRLLAELRGVYANADFQRQYHELRPSGRHVEFAVQTQAFVLTRYGFEGSIEGVMEMKAHTSFWAQSAIDATCNQLRLDIHDLMEYGTPWGTEEMNSGGNQGEEGG